MDKFCIFCGEKPDKKSKEHVIPQWLIEYTGNPKRTARFGFDLTTSKIRESSFDQFSFPACKKCNKDFGILESKAKVVLLQLFNGESIIHEDLNIFMDWFDKIRIGLWLAFYYLDGNRFGIKPKYYIANRIRKSDRMIAAYNINNDFKGISFIGCDTPAFQHMPSCFSLMIDNFCFFNVSKEFLFTKRMGLPYLSDCYYKEKAGGSMLGISRPGTEVVSKPIVDFKLLEPCFELYQPMLGIKDINGKIYKHVYENNYVKENCLNWEEGVGKIFVKQKDNVYCYTEQEKLNFDSQENISVDKFYNNIVYQTLKCQNYLTTIGASIKKLPLEEQRLIKKQNRIVRNINEKIIKGIKADNII